MCYRRLPYGAREPLSCWASVQTFFFSNHGILAQSWVHLSGMQTPSIPAPGPVQHFPGPPGRSAGSVHSPPEGGPFYFTARGGQLSRWAPTDHSTAVPISVPLPLQKSELPCPHSACDRHCGQSRGVLHLSCSAHAVPPP